MKRPFLLAVGGAHVDRRGRLADRHVAGASNPGTMREDVGGGAFNALRVAAGRGLSGAIASLRGGDMAGETVAAAIAAAGLQDLSGVFLDRASPSYTAILDARGELITALADMELYEAAFTRHLARRSFRDAAARADAMLIDANMPETAIEAVIGAAGEKPVFAIAISPAKARRLRGVLERLTCLFMNAREAHALAGTASQDGVETAAARLRERGLAAGMISRGEAPLLAFDSGGTWEMAPPPAGKVADVTGAGDALAGAAIAAMLAGGDLVSAAHAGLAAAKLAVEADTAVPDMASDAFEAALALVGAPGRVS